MPAHSIHTFDSTSPNHLVELYASKELTNQQVQSWSQLAEESLEPNPYYAPEFVLPLVECLGPDEVNLLVVSDRCNDWQFAAPVVTHNFEQGLPLPKFRALRSDYIFLNSPLVTQHNSAFILTCLFNALSAQRNWHGLGFAKTVANSEQCELIEFLATVSDVEVNNSTRLERPCVRPQSQEDLLANCSGSRRKTLRKGWKKLAQIGDVGFCLKKEAADIPSAVDAFLALEALGWKGTEGTAMSCDDSHSTFFKMMCEEFGNQNRVVFGELTLNNEVIASTCNLLSGDRLFAFKIGWDNQYSNCSLGYWSEILLADAVSKELQQVKLIDSCSDADSYTGKVWQERLEIGSSVLIWSRRAKLMRGAKKAVKMLVKS